MTLSVGDLGHWHHAGADFQVVSFHEEKSITGSYLDLARFPSPSTWTGLYCERSLRVTEAALLVKTRPRAPFSALDTDNYRTFKLVPAHEL